MLGFEKKDNTFSKAKGAEKRRIHIEVGDSKSPDFMPQFKTMHWDNEVNFSMRLKEEDYSGAIVRESSGNTEWEKNGRIARMYEKDTGDEDGGFEFEVELASKPASNVLEFSVQSKGLDFFYQPDLTQEDILEGLSREDNIIGSYAVYHKTKKDNTVGENEYRTGKAFHIYRPWAEDANGDRVWCELHIDAETEEMTVTVPQDFLDNAAYPVIVDPTFGYTTLGGTAATLAGSTRLSKAPGTITGTLTSISIGAKLPGSTGTVRWYSMLNKTDSEAANSHGEVAFRSANATFTTTPTWFTQTHNSVLLTGISYLLNMFFHNGTNKQIMGDVSTSATRYQTALVTEDLAQEDPWNQAAGSSTFISSIYLTYATAMKPVVDTDAATSVASGQADLNGEIIHIGSASNTTRGFKHQELLSTTTYTEGFEAGLGDWVNDSENWSDWRRITGATGSANTGASAASVGSWYMYIEASSAGGGAIEPGDTDIMYTDCYSGTMTFDYHQWGTNQGTLHVDTYNPVTDTWTSQWSSTGDQGNLWNTGETVTIPTGHTKVRFRNVAAGGFLGDVCIDNIQIPVATWDTEVDTNETGTYTAGTFSLTPTGLAAETVHRFKAYSTSTEGTTEGEYFLFTTTAAPSGNPSAFFNFF